MTARRLCLFIGNEYYLLLCFVLFFKWFRFVLFLKKVSDAVFYAPFDDEIKRKQNNDCRAKAYTQFIKHFEHPLFQNRKHQCAYGKCQNRTYDHA